MLETYIEDIKNKMTEIPYLIDVKEDKTLWTLMHTCNMILLELVEDYILDEKTIKLIQTEYNGYIKMINSMVSDKSKFFLVNLYFCNMLEYINDYAIEIELFETCHNIKMFLGDDN